jgi:2-iminobutanoate/2-iminopropanoate deaminase
MSGQQVVHVPGMKAIGPYSQAVRGGGLLFVSGRPPLTRLPEGLLALRSKRRLVKHSGILRPSSKRAAANSSWLSTPLVWFRVGSNFPEVNRPFAQFFLRIFPLE